MLDIFDLPANIDATHIRASYVDARPESRIPLPPASDIAFVHESMVESGGLMKFVDGRARVVDIGLLADRGEILLDFSSISVYSRAFLLPAELRRQVVDDLRTLRPKAEYYEFTHRLVRTLGKFNACAIRRGDFLTIGVAPRARTVSGKEIAANLASRFTADRPLVVCTDAQSEDPVFAPLRKQFPDCIFLNDLIVSDPHLSRDFLTLRFPGESAITAISYLVAIEAVAFVGTLFSTFTAWIQRRRGLRNPAEEFLYCYADWPRSVISFKDCAYLPNNHGPFSWNRTVFPVDTRTLAWFREWPESFSV
ncbi:MAG: O-fucosyltransferase family protein [Chloroflexi bacterium]|nr:O-fucosyltransferase family protein [Chloroflexota bacterium]